MLQGTWKDVRYGLRLLLKNPGFTAVAVLSLALGIGANTAIFTIIDAVMLRMLPVKNPQELMSLRLTEPSERGFSRWTDGNSETAFPYPGFAEMRARNQVFSSLIAFKSTGRLNVEVDGGAEIARGQLVTADYFRVLGVRLILGRDFTDADDRPGAEPVAIIGHGYWQRRFGGDRSVVGKKVVVNGLPCTIAGVTSPEFFGLQPGGAVDISLPLALQPVAVPRLGEPDVSLFTATNQWWLEAAGRLKPGVTEAQALANMDLLFKSTVLDAIPESKKVKPAALPALLIEPAGRGLGGLRRQFEQPLTILMIVVGAILLIACANVANLLLAKAATRQKEIAVRLSMGATRWRLIRQLLVESMMISALGGISGSVLAYWGSTLLVTMIQQGNNRLTLDLRPNLNVLAFTAAACILTGLLFGLAPAFRATRVDLTPALKQNAASLGGGRQRMGLTKSLVVSQVALSLVLLSGATLFVRSLVNLQSQNVGFSRDNLLLFGIAPREAGYKGVRYANLCRDIQNGLARLPGVQSATSSLHLLLSGSSRGNSLTIPGYTAGANERMSVQVLPVGTDFLPTMGITLLQGRDLNARDDENAPKVALVNETMARKYWAGQNPVGRRFKLSKLDMEVVGVVQDARYNSLRKEIAPVVYHPFVQDIDSMPHMHFEVRTAGDAAALIPAVRAVVASLDARLPLFDVKTQTEQIDELLLQERLFARLTGFFGVLALTLVCVGLYGIMSYAVARRTSEIGIRMALGARSGNILGMVLRETLTLVGAGVVIGVAASLVTAKLADAAISGLLFGVKITDVSAIVFAAGVLAAIALLAGSVPARRASRVDPMVALRSE